MRAGTRVRAPRRSSQRTVIRTLDATSARLVTSPARSGLAARERSPGRHLATDVDHRGAQRHRVVVGLEQLHDLEPDPGQVAGQQAGAPVAVTRLAGVEDLAVSRGRPGRRAVADVQPPVALGVIEQLTEQIVDPLAGRRGEARGGSSGVAWSSAGSPWPARSAPSRPCSPRAGRDSPGSAAARTGASPRPRARSARCTAPRGRRPTSAPRGRGGSCSASTSRSDWSMRSASRSGVRLIPSSSARATWDITAPGASSPSRIAVAHALVDVVCVLAVLAECHLAHAPSML